MKNALLYGICASGADFHGGIAFQMTIEFILQPWVSFMVLMTNCVFPHFYERVLAGELYDALPYETGQCKRCGLADRHFDKSFSHSRKHNGGGISFWQI